MKRREENVAGGRTSKFRRRCLKDSAKQVFESIPQIPINVKEIKKIILKDQFINNDQSIDDSELLNVLTTNSKGRNALFYKAHGHTEVFGLRSSIPDGSTQLLTAGKSKVKEEKDIVAGKVEESVCYVQLPDGYPVITDDQGESSSKSSGRDVDPLSLDSEVITLDSDDGDDTPQVLPPQPDKPKPSPSERPKREVASRKLTSPVVIKPPPPEPSTSKPKVKNDSSANSQQRSPGASQQRGSPGRRLGSTRCVARKSSNTNEIDIPYTPSTSELQYVKPRNTKEILTSIPGFNIKKVKLNKLSNSTRKLSCAQMIQQTKEGQLNLESPESILGQVNLRGLLNKGTFSRLPGAYQFKLQQLLPETDRLYDEKRGLRLNCSAFNNEFYAKASHEWRERLLKGDFTPEALQKSKNELDSDRRKLDSWKRKHFEPVWGEKKKYTLFNSFEDYVAGGDVSIEAEIQAAKSMQSASAKKLKLSINKKTESDVLSTSEEEPFASTSTSVNDNVEDIDMLVMMKDDENILDDKPQDSSIATVTVNNDSNVVASDPLAAASPVSVLQNDDSKLMTENDFTKIVASEDLNKDSLAILESSKEQPKASEESLNRVLDDKESIDQDNIIKDLTVIDVDKENLVTSSERTFGDIDKKAESDSVKESDLIVVKDDDNIGDKVGEDSKVEAENVLRTEKDIGKGDPLVQDLAEKLDFDSNTLKETQKETAVDLENPDERDNQKDNPTEESILEEPHTNDNNYDDKDDNIQIHISNKIGEQEEAQEGTELKTKENQEEFERTENENLGEVQVNEQEDIKGESISTSYVVDDGKKEAASGKEKPNNVTSEAFVPTITVSVIGEDDQEKIKDLIDLALDKKNEPLTTKENIQIGELKQQENKSSEDKTSLDIDDTTEEDDIDNATQSTESLEDESKENDYVSIDRISVELNEESSQDEPSVDVNVEDNHSKKDEALVKDLSDSTPMEIDHHSDDVITKTTIKDSIEESSGSVSDSNNDQDKARENVRDENINDNKLEPVTEMSLLDKAGDYNIESLADSRVDCDTVTSVDNIDQSRVDNDDKEVGVLDDYKTELPVTVDDEMIEDSQGVSSVDDDSVQQENMDTEDTKEIEEDDAQQVESETNIEVSVEDEASELLEDTENTEDIDETVTEDFVEDNEINTFPQKESAEEEENNKHLKLLDSNINQSVSNAIDMEKTDADTEEKIKKEDLVSVTESISIMQSTVSNVTLNLRQASADIVFSNTAISNVSLNARPTTNVDFGESYKTINQVAMNIRPASADLPNSSGQVAPVIYRPASVGIELDKILVNRSETSFKSEQDTTIMSIVERPSISNLRMKPFPKTNNTSNIGNKVMLKSYGAPLLPKQPASAVSKNYTNYVCNTKAFLMCQSCGAFCHDECLNQQKLCISCVIK